MIKYFVSTCFLRRTVDHRRQRPKIRKVGQNYWCSDAVHRMLKPRNTRDFNGALDTRKLCLPGNKQLAPSHPCSCANAGRFVNVVTPSIIGRACALILVRHSCQPSRNGRDSPRLLGRVPVEGKYQQCPGIYAHLALSLA